MGRKPLYILTDVQMRNLILKYGIDEGGLKVPLRELFSNQDFMYKSGYYRTNLLGMKMPVSTGSLPSLARKLKVTAEDMHKHYIQKGLVTVDFETWLKMSKKVRKKYNNMEVKGLIIQFFGLEYSMITKEIEELLLQSRKKYLNVGLTDEDFENDLKYFLNSYELKYRQLTRLNSENNS